MSDLQERLNALAGRGTPRGFDAVFEDALQRADVDLEAVTDTETDIDTAEMASPDVIPFVTADPATRRRRRPFSSMIAAAGLTTALLVGMLAMTAIVGSGGAGSPEAAVKRLADAVRHEDPLSAANVLAPTEVQSLNETVDAAQKKAAELALVKQASAPLAGVDFDVKGLGLSTEQLGPDHVKVIIDTGEFTASTEKAKFSPIMQKALRNNDGDNSTSVQLPELWRDQDPNMGAFLVTVKQGGSWYVSAAYTALEYVRVYNQLPTADYGAGLRDAAQLGADTPGAAVEEGMRALAASDWAKLISLAPPSELPLYDYRDALIEFARQNDAQTDITVDKLSTTEQIDGDTAQVTLKASGTSGESDTWAIDGGCFTQSIRDGENDEPFRWCVGDRFNMMTTMGLTDSPANANGGDGSTNTIKVVRENGRWFLSPVNTSLDILNTWIDNADRKSIYTMLGVADQLPPDGPLTLNQPVDLKAAGGTTSHIFEFEGKGGQEIVGEIGPANYEPGSVSIALYDGNGNYVDEGRIPLYGTRVKLPADGKYKAIVTVYGFENRDLTLTLWDVKQAPASVKNPVQECRNDGPGGTSCFTTEEGTLPIGETPTGMFGGPEEATSAGSSSSDSFKLPDDPGSAGSVCSEQPDGSMACVDTVVPTTVAVPVP